jgi:hypothetical protein
MQKIWLQDRHYTFPLLFQILTEQRGGRSRQAARTTALEWLCLWSGRFRGVVWPPASAPSESSRNQDGPTRGRRLRVVNYPT